MHLNEQQAASMRVESKRAALGMGNTILPIYHDSPFRTCIKSGDIVGFRQIMSGGDSPIFLYHTGWQVIGFRHDPSTCRQRLVVLYKDGRTINVGDCDVLISK